LQPDAISRKSNRPRNGENKQVENLATALVRGLPTDIGDALARRFCCQRRVAMTSIEAQVIASPRRVARAPRRSRNREQT
jgi:hypothetical protein